MKIRADVLAVKQGLFPSREQAQLSIMAGLVHTENTLIDKPGTFLDESIILIVKKSLIPYVSRGGLKLEKAYQVFNVNPQGKLVMDIGSSTGGFVDCSLQKGANNVYSIDVTTHLDYKLRSDNRVIVLDNTNFRYLEPTRLAIGFPDIVTIDVSFISLNLIFANLVRMIKSTTDIIALIKPQFEAERHQIARRGIIKDKKVMVAVINKVIGYAKSYNLYPQHLDFSPITGKKEGNIEYLIHLNMTKVPFNFNIEEVVEKAYNILRSGVNKNADSTDN